MSAVVHPFFARRVATPTPVVEPVADPTPLAESVAEPEGGYSLVEDLYGNIWRDFTKDKYEAFTYKGIQLKRHIGGGVWRRNGPWKRTVWWDEDDEDNTETYEEYAARKEYEWYAQAVYLYDVDGIPDEKE